MAQPLITIPARRGKAALVAAGQEIKIVNTHGQQVVDTWAFNRSDMSEYMSMEHSRVEMLRLIPRVNDVMLTNHRRPILTFVEDTSGGVHDMLIAACDRYRYEQLGHKGKHDNCADNMVEALREHGLVAPCIPAPLNLFMNVPWTRQGDLSLEVPTGSPGGFVILRAGMDIVVVFSACPQDMVPINGEAMKPTEAHFVVLG